MAGNAGAYVEVSVRRTGAAGRARKPAARCAVVGEDLGTVPEGFREAMRAANMLSYRIVISSGDGTAGLSRRRPSTRHWPPPRRRRTTSPSLKGFWLGRDIEWRRRLGLYPDAAAEATEAGERHRDRRLLLEALAREGLIARDRFGEFLPEGGEPVYAASSATRSSPIWRARGRG